MCAQSDNIDAQVIHVLWQLAGLNNLENPFLIRFRLTELT